MDVQNSKEVIEHFANENKDVKFELILKKWLILKEIVYLLQIPLRATISIQKQDLTLSDAYEIWITMKLHFEAVCTRGKFKTNLAKHLLNALQTRNKFVFNNKFMKCALFLDPKYRRQILNDTIVTQEAKETLSQLWRRIQVDDVATNNLETPDFDHDSIDFHFDVQEELKRYLMHQTEDQFQIDSDSTQHESIEILLDLYDPDTMREGKSILEYWDTVKEIHPKLHQLAMIVFAIPPTEVQIERDFSKLKYVFSDRRCKIQSERLEDIMIININPEIFYLVKEDELIDAIKNK